MGDRERDYRRQGRDRRKERARGRNDAFGDRKARQQVELNEYTAADLVKVMAALLEMDGALRVGRSRDRGAWALGVYLDGENRTEYVGASESLAEWADDFLVWLRGTARSDGSDEGGTEGS